MPNLQWNSENVRMLSAISLTNCCSQNEAFLLQVSSRSQPQGVSSWSQRLTWVSSWLQPTRPARLLLILAYHKTGSTYLGELLNQNPDVFYSFEPLDGLYTAMYGTENGWAVPDDISHHRNGSIRSVARHQSSQERLH